MPRTSRKQSESGYYHIILRGVNRQEIFHDDADRSKFLDTLRRYADDGIDILAYCLMDNHAHLLLHAGEELSLFIKKIASSYVYYFNHKYDRVGHLFQDRYRSEAVETDEYLLMAARYILQNPQKAGICKASEYEWSSWNETVTGIGLCNTQPLCDTIGSHRALMDFLLMPANDRCLETNDRTLIRDDEANRILCRICGRDNAREIAEMTPDERKACLARAKREGVTIRQIARLTGLDRNLIQRA